MPQMIAPEKVQTRQCTINDAQEFFEAVQGSQIAVILISAQDVRDKETSLGLIEMFENAVPIRGIAEYHCIGIDGNRNLSTKRYSTEAKPASEEGTSSEVNNEPNSVVVPREIELGMWYPSTGKQLITGLLVESYTWKHVSRSEWN